MNLPAGLQVLRCAIHVHTSEDDGDESPEAIHEAAVASGVDVLCITGHNHLQSPNLVCLQGYRDGLLTVIGRELNTRSNDHLLSFGIHDRVATRLLTPRAALDLLERLGGTVFVAHPQGRPTLYLLRRRHAWQDWDLRNYAGLEIWSYMHDWIASLSPLRLPEMCREPAKFIRGPDPEVLRQWDAVAEGRRVAGIGALDAHGRRLPLGLSRALDWARDGILPYRQNFEAFSTYVIAAEPSGDGRTDAAGVVAALAEARAWACHDALHPGRDLRYLLDDGNDLHLPGSEVPFKNGLRLLVRSPVTARLRILCRGESVAEEIGTELTFSPVAPGAYRLQAEIDGRPWIFTNHIYLRPPAANRNSERR